MGGTVQRSKAAIALYPNQAIATWAPIIAARDGNLPSIVSRASGSTQPSVPRRAITRSRMTHVLTAHQPMSKQGLHSCGNVVSAAAEGGPGLHHGRCARFLTPATQSTRTTACRSGFPAPEPERCQRSPRPRWMPNAPRTQLIGARLAPAQDPELSRDSSASAGIQEWAAARPHGPRGPH